MLLKPPGHYKSRSSGLAPKHGWQMEGISVSSREPTHNSTTEDVEIKERLIQIRTGRENILPPKNGFKYVGFKSNGRIKSRHAAARSELPSLAAYKGTQFSPQLSPLIINQSAFVSPPTTNRMNQNRNGRSGTGYYLKPVSRRDAPQNVKTSESRNNSSSHRDDNSRVEKDKGEENSMYELAMSKINYWPALDNILEESPIVGGLKPRNVIKERDYLEEITSRRGPPGESNPGTQRNEVEINAKNITDTLKKQSELRRNADRMIHSGKETPIKKENASEYFNVNQTALNRDVESRLDRLSFHPNLNTLLGLTSTMNSSRSRGNGNGQYDPTVPKAEVRKFHKESFMKLVYKGMGQHVSGSKRDKFFEQMCEEKRLAFKKKMNDMKAVKKE